MIADFDIEDFVRRVLAEDLGEGGDVTSKATFSLVMLLSTLAETGPRETPPLLTIPAG